MGCPYCSRCKEYFKDKKDFNFHKKWHFIVDKFGCNVVKVGYDTYYVIRDRTKAKPGMRIEVWNKDGVTFQYLSEDVLDTIISKAYLPSISDAIWMCEKTFKHSMVYGGYCFSNYLGEIIEANIKRMIDEKMKKD